MKINKGSIGMNHSVGSDIWTKATHFALLIRQYHRIEVMSGDPAQQMISIKVHCWRSRLFSKVLRVFAEVLQIWKWYWWISSISVWLKVEPPPPQQYHATWTVPTLFDRCFTIVQCIIWCFPRLEHLNYLVCMCVVYLFYSNIWYQDRVQFGASVAATYKVGLKKVGLFFGFFLPYLA